MNSNNKNRKSHLDQLLEDKPAEFQAKVLRFAMDSGMHQEDPAFQLVQYIGYLAQLTETAPTEWQRLFKRLHSELNEWTQITAEQLTTAADQSETINNLAQSCNRLGTALNALDLTSQQQLKQLSILSKASPNLKTVLEEIPTLKKQLMNLSQHLSNNQIPNVELNQYQMRELKKEISTNSRSRELLTMHDQIEKALQNQKLMMQQIHKSSIKGIEEIIQEALNWICRADMCTLTFIGSFTLIFFMLALLGFTHLVFRGHPVNLNYYTQTQIERTQNQVENIYTKVQRIEEYFNLAPKQKRKK